MFNIVTLLKVREWTGTDSETVGNLNDFLTVSISVLRVCTCIQSRNLVGFWILPMYTKHKTN